MKCAKKPCAVVEGRTKKNPENEIDAIVYGGEIAFVAFLAHKAKVPVFCFEPPRSVEMNWLTQRFSKEEVEYYYFARIVAQWHRQNQKKSIEEYVLPFLERDKKTSGWRDFEFSIGHMRKIHHSLFQGELDFSNADFFKKIENPTRKDNLLKNIVRASSKYRDSAIMDGIKKLINQRYDIFIVYGRGHAEIYQKELEKYIGRPAQN
ncbi:MAG: hypothetical protein AAB585_00130 [Patescibacteria group bacterium]